MDDISKKVLEEISQKNIKPCPRWQFQYKNYFFWFLLSLLVISGAVALSALILIFGTNLWEAENRFSGGLPAKILFLVPYFWGVAALLFAVCGYYAYKSTKKGYKCGTCRFFGVSGFLVIVISLLAIFSGFSSIFHRALSDKSPIYRNMIYDKDDIWNDPSSGILSGKIREKPGCREFILSDPGGRLWDVKLNASNYGCDFAPRPGQAVKMMGHRDGESIFFADTISPWTDR